MIAIAPGAGAGAGDGWYGYSAPYSSGSSFLVPAASVQGDAEPLEVPDADVDTGPAVPVTPRFEKSQAAWSSRLQEMLLVAGFDNAILLSEQDLARIGDRLTAAWIAPDGDLFGFLYVFPAKEPRSTMQTFVDKMNQNCLGQFDGGVATVDAIKDRSIGRAEATCREPSKATYYDMIFYFTPGGTVGISHVGYNADLDRARKINNGLSDIFRGL